MFSDLSLSSLTIHYFILLLFSKSSAGQASFKSLPYDGQIMLLLQWVGDLLNLKCKHHISNILSILIDCQNIPRINTIVVYQFYCNHNKKLHSINKKLFTGWVKGHLWELFWTLKRRRILINSRLCRRLMVTNAREQMRIIKVYRQQRTQKPSSCFPGPSVSLLVEIKELFDILFNEFLLCSLLSW